LIKGVENESLILECLYDFTRTHFSKNCWTCATPQRHHLATARRHADVSARTGRERKRGVGKM